MQTLQNEFTAGEGSFLILLRPHMKWDKDAFNQLTQAMEQCCKEAEHAEYVLKWVAEGFWFIPSFVRNWTSHPSWNLTKASDLNYYEAAYTLLDDLATWFFTGNNPRRRASEKA